MAKANRLAKTKNSNRDNFVPIKYTDSRGRKQNAWRMDKAGSLAVLLSLKGERFDELRMSISNEFVRQERELEQWRGSRETLKLNHLTFTDEVQKLHADLKEVGSRGAGHIYSNVQLWVNKAATGATGKGVSDFREKLPQDDLRGIKVVEDLTAIVLDHWRGEGISGRDLSESVKTVLKSDIPNEFIGVHEQTGLEK